MEKKSLFGDAHWRFREARRGLAKDQIRKHTHLALSTSVINSLNKIDWCLKGWNALKCPNTNFNSLEHFFSTFFCTMKYTWRTDLYLFSSGNSIAFFAFTFYTINILNIRSFFHYRRIKLHTFSIFFLEIIFSSNFFSVWIVRKRCVCTDLIEKK